MDLKQFIVIFDFINKGMISAKYLPEHKNFIMPSVPELQTSEKKEW